MFHVAFGGFHQIRNQIVAPLELDLDLRERVLVAIPIRDELVEDTRHHRGQRDDDEDKQGHKNDNGRHDGPPPHVDERTYGDSTLRL